MQRKMNQNPANLIGAKLVNRTTNLVDALFNDPTEHESEAKLFDALLAVRQDLRGTVVACRESHQTDRRRASTPQLAGGHVRSEADLFHHLLDTLPGSIGNVRHAVNHSRHRLIRDSR